MKKHLFIAAVLGTCSFSSIAQEQRVSLFEIFTSSTCGPCATGNTNYDNIVKNKPAGEYVTVKYQQFGPGAGDPYCTKEGKNRFLNYYNQGATSIGIPEMEIDGGWKGNAGAFTDALYTSARAVPASYKLSGSYTVNGKTVTAKVKSTAITMGTDAKLYVAIVETKTIKNAKSNGETEFHNVMKKMMPSETGTPLSSGIGVAEEKTLTFTFMGDYRLPIDGQEANMINHNTEHSVENFANLKVVAWVQGADKKVYQAANLTKSGGTSVNEISTTVGSITVYPNPANNIVNVKFEMTQPDEVSAMIVNLSGTIVNKKNVKMISGKNDLVFDLNSLATGYYNIVIFDSHNNSFAQRLAVVH